MKKCIMGYLVISTLLVLMGCQKVNTNPYELKKEVRQSMTPEEQEAFISMYQSLEDLVLHLNDDKVSYEEDIELIKSFYEKVPEDWQWEKQETPMDLCWFYILTTMDGLMGCQNYSNYADCKDAIDEVGGQLSELFTDTYDRRYSILVDENRFYTLYTEGKKQENIW